MDIKNATNRTPVRIKQGKYAQQYIETWGEDCASDVETMVNGIVSMHEDYAMIFANGPNIKVPLTELEVLPLPHLPHWKDCKTMTVSATLDGIKSIHDLAYDYCSTKAGYALCGSTIDLFYVDTETVAVRSKGAVRKHKVSFETLKSFKPNF